MHIFLDANVLFSGADQASATHSLISKLLNLRVELVVNPHVVEETLRNITSKRSRCLPGLKNLIGSVTISNTVFIDVGVSLPADDMAVIAGAVGTRCDYLWTGDKPHFGHLYGKSVHGVSVISGEMLHSMLSGDEPGNRMMIMEKRKKYESK